MSEQQPSGQLATQTLAMPMDANPNGDIFGGWLLSQMDLAAGILAKKFSHSRTTTVALDSMVFKKAVWVGDIVSCHSEILKVGSSSMKVKVEAWVERQLTDEKYLVTEGVFTFVAINAQGKPHPADPKKR